MKQRALILTENGMPIFRQDFVVNGNDNLERDIAVFVHQLAIKKDMVNALKVVKNINQLEHFGVNNIIDFFSQPQNIQLFVRELNGVSTEAKNYFSRDNIRYALAEALK